MRHFTPLPDGVDAWADFHGTNPRDNTTWGRADVGHGILVGDKILVSDSECTCRAWVEHVTESGWIYLSLDMNSFRCS